MTRSEFVQALKMQTSDASVFGTTANLEHPPGRKPRQRDVMLSNWYCSLPDSDRNFVRAIMREAAELAVFSFLSILDGVSAVESGNDKGDLHLIYSKGDINILLNNPSQEFLHDEYNHLCQSAEPLPTARLEAREYEVGPAEYLRSLQTSNDGMDLHALPTDGERVQDPEAPAIALPKNEHRKL